MASVKKSGKGAEGRKPAMLKLSALKTNPDNPRQIRGEQFERLKRSIKEFPEMLALRPMVTDAEGVVLGGNMRLEALKALGYKEVPADWVKRASELTPEQRREFVIKDNGQFGEWNWSELANAWSDLPLADWGLDIPQEWLTPDEGKGEDGAAAEALVDRAEELQGTWKVKRGQIWQLGRHRLMCGDSTDAVDVAKLMGARNALLCFTSPPYADQREYEGGKELSPEYLAGVFASSAGFVSLYCINLGMSRKDGEVNCYWDVWIEKARESGLKFLSWNIWDRQYPASIAQQTAMFPTEHEWILVFGERRDLNRTIKNKVGGQRKPNTTNRQPDGSLVARGDRVVNSHRALGTIYRGDIHRGDSPHPAMFPVDLPKAYIEACTERDDAVFEPFSGSGQTLIAAELSGRTALAMELEPKYAAVALQRYADLANETPIKL
jgi:DNA modification methylase